MSTATTTKPIHLGQLAAELGGAGLTMYGDGSDEGAEKTIVADGIAQAALDAAIEAHIAPRYVPLDQFRELFTPAERKLIRESPDDYVQEMWEKAMSVGRINLNSDEVIGGLAYLTEHGKPDGTGILTAERPAQIRSGETPA